jgi:hypothetical protein
VLLGARMMRRRRARRAGWASLHREAS